MPPPIADPFALGLLALYSEIHFRFPFLPSRLWRKEPEIIADIPHRLEPSSGLPVLLVIKDAHRYPVELLEIAITQYGDHSNHSEIIACKETISDPYWYKIFWVESQYDNTLRVDVEITYLCRNKKIKISGDNLPGTSRAPLLSWSAQEPLPYPTGWLAGDPHVHTRATEDQVEYGPPVEGLVGLGRAQGLSWFTATDHSYDLDDTEGFFIKPDPDWPRWKRLVSECKQHSRDEFAAIAGEEVSVGNSDGKTVHLLGMGLSTPLVGTSDGAESSWPPPPDSYIPDAVGKIARQGGLAIASHPKSRPGFLERLLLRRGHWKSGDLDLAALSGSQFWNGVRDRDMQAGLSQWIQQLLKGNRLVALGGNDSHGSFSRSRQIAVPCWSISESTEQLYGRVKSVVRAGSTTTEAILDGIERGRVVLSDGPWVEIKIALDDGSEKGIGETCNTPSGILTVETQSTDEFGKIKDVKVWMGNEDDKREKIIFQGNPERTERWCWSGRKEFPERGYIRAEVTTELDRWAMTNPIWLVRKT